MNALLVFIYLNTASLKRGARVFIKKSVWCVFNLHLSHVTGRGTSFSHTEDIQRGRGNILETKFATVQLDQLVLIYEPCRLH